MVKHFVYAVSILMCISSQLYSAPLDGQAAIDSTGGKQQVYRVSKNKEYIFERPGRTDFIKNAPSILQQHAGSYIQKKNVPLFGVIAASTVALTAVDQELITSSQKFGRDVGISNFGNQMNISPVSFFDLYLPTDFGSSLYFLGDGLTHLSIDAAFFTYGLIEKDNRALQTASQSSTGYMVVGTCVQILKHSTGRESPNEATAPNGKWRVFPNQIDTFKNVPKYDAFPSGHLATAMVTVTVIGENYPEYKFIRPVGYTLLTLLSYQMMNNGVHWMSDYPLALFMGYDIGKKVVKNGRTVRNLESSPDNPDKKSFLKTIDFTPIVFENHGVGIQSSVMF
jgi:hypothetical protein